MKTIKVAEATDVQLDWLVAKCEGIDLFETEGWLYNTDEGTRRVYRPTTDWAQMGPIIERERLAIQSWIGTGWVADSWNFRFSTGYSQGLTPLIAAARCYVTSKLGDTVEVPEELS
jgi:hypothetical protein